MSGASEWTYLHHDHEHVASVLNGPWKGLPITQRDVSLMEMVDLEPHKSAMARIPLMSGGQYLSHARRLAEAAQDGEVWSQERERELVGAVVDRV